MTVTNRKMFNRGARNKVRQMGGIMAASEPLIQEVARFQPGGSVFSPRAGDKILGVTLGGIGGRATEGTQMTGSTLRNLLSAPNAAEIEQRLLSNFEADVSRQRLNNILEKYLIKGPPIKKTITKDVIKDKPVLNVKYLNTFKKEYWSTSEVKKLNSI